MVTYMYKIIVKNGYIVDGSSKKGFYSDLLVEGGIIRKIGTNFDEENCDVIDATRLYVAPGFVDSHSHSDMELFNEPSGYNVLGQGITTQITGQCGMGLVPFCVESLTRENSIPETKWEYCKEKCNDFSTYVDFLKTVKMPTNYAMYIAHGAVRERVMGFSGDIPSNEQMERMKEYLHEGMRCGFLGYSSCLVYPPSCYANKEELIALAKVVGEYNGTYVSHVRNEGDYIEDAVIEAIEIGKKAGVSVTISHLKVEGKHNKGKSNKLLRLVEQANEEGFYVRADQYPYDGGCAPLILQIPPKYLTDGIDSLLENLTDSELRKRIHYSIFNESDECDSALYTAGYDNTMISYAKNGPSYVGSTIEQIAKKMGKEPIDAMCDMLIESNGEIDAIYLSQNSEDILNIMSSPYVAGGTDGSDYPIFHSSEDIGGDHPRAIGAMPMRLRLIRDNKLMSIEQAIYQMTCMPAEMAGIKNIGLIKEGYKADICIFDYETVAEGANYHNPYKSNKGIKYVLVGGKIAFMNGIVTGEKNGEFLRLNR